VSLLKKRSRGALIASSVFALGLSGVVLADPASASDLTCNVWSDSQTAGFSCNGPQTSIFTTAYCQDDWVMYGPDVPTNSGEWSYAYCSGHGGLASFYVTEVRGGAALSTAKLQSPVVAR
jgi:hypothetical protein